MSDVAGAERATDAAAERHQLPRGRRCRRRRAGNHSKRDQVTTFSDNLSQRITSYPYISFSLCSLFQVEKPKERERLMLQPAVAARRRPPRVSSTLFVFVMIVLQPSFCSVDSSKGLHEKQSRSSSIGKSSSSAKRPSSSAAKRSLSPASRSASKSGRKHFPIFVQISNLFFFLRSFRQVFFLLAPPCRPRRSPWSITLA